MFASAHGAAPSGECLRGEGLVCLIGAVVCVVDTALRSRTIGSCQSTATSCDCTARLVAASPRKYSAIVRSPIQFHLNSVAITERNTTGPPRAAPW